MSQSVRSDSVRPLAPPPEVRTPAAPQRPASPLVLVPASERPVDTRPSRSILSEQLSKRADEQAVTSGAARPVPRGTAARAAALPAAASDPVLPLCGMREAGAEGQGCAARPRGFREPSGEEGSEATPAAEEWTVGASSGMGRSAYSPDMSGEFDM